jgi:hypothetical protein
MTRDEIRVVLFILAALIVGALYRHWRMLNPPQPAPVVEVSKKWAKPPYVFKNEKEMERRAKAVEEEFPPASPKPAE